MQKQTNTWLLVDLQGISSSDLKDVQRSSERSPSLGGRLQIYTPRKDTTPLRQNGRRVSGCLFLLCFGACMEIFLYCCFTILKLVGRDWAYSSRSVVHRPLQVASPTEQEASCELTSLSQTLLLIQQTFTETLPPARFPAL